MLLSVGYHYYHGDKIWYRKIRIPKNLRVPVAKAYKHLKSVLEPKTISVQVTRVFSRLQHVILKRWTFTIRKDWQKIKTQQRDLLVAVTSRRRKTLSTAAVVYQSIYTAREDNYSLKGQSERTKRG